MMKRLIVGLFAAITLGFGSWQLYGNPQQKRLPEELKPFMQLKLEHSKSILEALAVEDFESMAKNAQALSLLSLESNWNSITTQEYIQQSSDFRRACQVIHEAAEERNVDRATLGFVNLTVRCVECHKYLRKNALLPAREILPTQP
jgi:hypothetical protein